MAPSHSFLLCWSLVLSLCPLIRAAPWIVTDNYQQVPITEPYVYYEDGPSSTTTSIQEITLTATSLPDAVSTITSINSLEPDVTVIQKLYPTGVGERLAYTDLLDDDDDDDDDTHKTIYKVNLTYSAPSSCSTHWTTTTAVSLNPPVMVEKLLPKTAVSTSVSVDNYQPFQPTTYTYGVVFVDPTQVPSTSMSDLRDRYHPSSLYVGSNCQYYNYYQNSYYDGDDDWFHDDYWMGISPFALTLILVIGWVGLWIILGFIESFVRFRRLMTGWQTRRGLPVCWAITILPITLLLLCFFRKGYRARTYPEAQELTKKWKAMSVWTKLRLFFIWGFRFKYPPMLGPPPPPVKMSKRPGPNLYPPPGVPPMAWAGAVHQGPPAANPGVNAVSISQPSPTQPLAAQPQPVAAEASGALSAPRDEEIGRAQ